MVKMKRLLFALLQNIAGLFYCYWATPIGNYVPYVGHQIMETSEFPSIWKQFPILKPAALSCV